MSKGEKVEQKSRRQNDGLDPPIVYDTKKKKKKKGMGLLDYSK